MYGDILRRHWREALLAAAGMLCVFAAGFLAQTTGLGRKLQLDFAGARTVGSAESAGERAYHLRYEHPSGTIYRRNYSGRLGGRPDGDAAIEIAVVYDPAEPSRFQPRGLSYLPGLGAGIAFVVGMTCLLNARRRVRLLLRKPGPRTPA